MKLRFLIPFLLALPLAAQTTRTAASSAESDVAATIALSSNGDTVQIPCSGTQTVIWTSQLQFSVSITLTALGGTPNTLPSQFGAGTNCLTIRDNVPLANGQMILATPTYSVTNNVTTIQNMNIDPFSTSTPLWNPISIQGTGTTSGMPQARIDNIVFGNSVQWNFSGNTVASTQLIKPDNVVGVADHNTAPSGNNNELMSCQMSSLYGVGAYGDNSWAEPDSFGGSLAWFNENNSWTGGQTFQDCTEAGNSFTQSGGGRLVNRFNMIFGSPFQIASGHGTESTGRPRAYRHIEAYNNTLNVPASGNPQGFVSARGGTILSHSNLAVMGSGAFMDQLFDITIFRRVFSSIPWGACGGLTTASGGSLSNTFPGDPWDTVDNTTYYTGTMSGVSSLTFTASGSPSWTTNQWAPAGAGYSVYDTTQGFVSEILSNTSNTLTINQNAGIGNSWSALANGDSFKIIRATVCQDQAGRGQGGYISGNPPTPSSALSQALDPVREWNDVIPASDVVFQYHTQFGGDILENRDYYTDEWKPGGLSGPTFQSSATVPFNGSTTCNNGGGGYTCGMGEGTLVNRPANCTIGVGYWATDQGNWNQSGQACTGNGQGAGQGCQGVLYTCTSTNHWSLSYQPYTYPHPLIGGGSTPQVALPTFSPSSGVPPQTVTTATTTSGATLCGRNDGGAPTATTPGTCDGSPTFLISGTQSVTINPTTLTAIGTKVGFLNSSVASATFSGSSPAATPVWSPGSGTYPWAATITIADPSTGCSSKIYWGSTNPPTTADFNTQVLNNYFAGTYYAKIIGCLGKADSAVASVTYGVQALTPTFSPVAGAYGPTQTVAIASGGSSVICYNTIGAPATNGTTGCATGTLYSGPVTVSASQTLYAVGGGTGVSDSPVGSAVYTINGPVAAPTLSPVAGSYGPAQTVAISSSTGGATIRYTTDGSTPTSSHGTIYSGPVSVSSSLTLKAIAYEAGFSDSTVTSGAYTINGAAATPTFSPAFGTVPQTVTILTATAGATICYTTDSSTPTATTPGTCSHGTTYSGPVSVTVATVLSAIATKAAFVNSAVGTATYSGFVPPPPTALNANITASSGVTIK